jgi:hypothetical protein
MLRAVVIVMLAAPSAHADDRKLFGIEGTLGVYQGIGAGVRIGDASVGVHITGAWQPLIISEKTAPGETPSLDFYSTWQVNADLYVLFSEPTPRSAIGATVGYKGNTDLGHGGGIGFYAEIDAHQAVSYFLIGGLYLFPRGESRLRDRENVPSAVEFNFPGPGLSWGINLGIVLSP